MPTRKNFVTVSTLSLASLLTLVITPRTNLDAINLPKLLVLLIGASIISLVFLLDFGFRIKPQAKRWHLLIASWIFVVAFVSFCNGSFTSRESLVGIYGRRFGLLSVLVILLITCISFLVADLEDTRTFTTAFSMTSLGVSIYFIAQTNGYDFANWSGGYGVANSTLGNPNFLSALAATSLTVSISILVFSKGLVHRTLGMANIPTSAFMLLKSNSFQGFLILTLGLSFLIIILIKRYLPPRISKVVLRIFGLIAALLSALNVSRALEFAANESTFQRRLDYWRAGLGMVLDRPILGFGWDSFGDWYLRYRDQKAVSAGIGIYTNSPHSLLIEIGTSAGLLLASAYVVFLLLVLRVIVVQTLLTLRGNLIGVQLVPLSLIWIGMTFQALINPVSLPLTLWHFLSGAFLLGIQRKISNRVNRKENPISKPSPQIGNKLRVKISNGGRYRLSGILKSVTFSIFAIPLFIGISLAYETYKGDADVYEAIARSDGQGLLVSVLDVDSDPELMKIAVRIFNDNSMKEFSIRILNELTRRDPNDFYAWKLLYDTSTSTTDRIRALARMKSLDPRNPELENLAP